MRVCICICMYIYNIHTHMWSTDSSLLMTQTLPRTWGVHKKGVPQLLAKNDAGPRPGPSREDRNLQGLMSGWIFKTQIFQSVYIWVCLKIGYIPNYSHLIGIMISKTIGFRGTLFSDTSIWVRVKNRVWIAPRWSVLWIASAYVRCLIRTLS